MDTTYCQSVFIERFIWSEAKRRGDIEKMKMIREEIKKRELKRYVNRVFPRLRTSCRESDVMRQALKIAEETGEVVRATGNDVEMARETYDVIHAAETLLDMLAELGVDLDAQRQWVENKNRQRGRYCDSD